MTSKLIFSEHIKSLLGGFVGKGNNLQFSDHFHDVQITQSQIYLGGEKGCTIFNSFLKLNNQIGGVLVSGKSNRFWSASQKSKGDMTQTPSFLG